MPFEVLYTEIFVVEEVEVDEALSSSPGLKISSFNRCQFEVRFALGGLSLKPRV